MELKQSTHICRHMHASLISSHPVPLVMLNMVDSSRQSAVGRAGPFAVYFLIDRSVRLIQSKLGWVCGFVHSVREILGCCSFPSCFFLFLPGPSTALLLVCHPSSGCSVTLRVVACSSDITSQMFPSRWHTRHCISLHKQSNAVTSAFFFHFQSLNISDKRMQCAIVG